MTHLMQAQIQPYAPEQEYYFHEGCHILELSNNSADEAVSIARARVLPKQTTKWHALAQTVERYVILQGQGMVEIGDLTAQCVQAYDVVIIPPNYRQRIHNTGEEDLIFLAICSPRFTPKHYQNLEPS